MTSFSDLYRSKKTLVITESEKELHELIFVLELYNIDIYGCYPVNFMIKKKVDTLKVLTLDQIRDTYKFSEYNIVIASSGYYSIIYINLIKMGIFPDDIYFASTLLVYLEKGKKILPQPFNQQQLIELQKTLLEILSIVHHICDKYCIPYIIYGGTLLGAVRHHGFIPWDDDVDILMSRKDYELFFDVCEKEIPVGYRIIRNLKFNTRLKFLNEVALVKCNTLLADRYPLDNSVISQEIMLDILPLDNVKNPGSLIQLFQKKATIALNAAYKIKYNKYEMRYRNNKFVKLLSYFPTLLLLKLNKKILSLMNSIDTRHVHFFSAYSNLETLIPKTFEREIITERVLLDFEGQYFWAPKNYNSVLLNLYGENFMQIPEQYKYPSHSFLKIKIT